jgi:hypothetical protein
LRLRWFVLLLLTCALVIPSKGAETDFGNRIAEIETETGSRIGAVALDSASGQRIEHRPNERFLNTPDQSDHSACGEI